MKKTLGDKKINKILTQKEEEEIKECIKLQARIAQIHRDYPNLSEEVSRLDRDYPEEMKEIRRERAIKYKKIDAAQELEMSEQKLHDLNVSEVKGGKGEITSSRISLDLSDWT